jgi:hypothetical protein
MRNKIAFLLAFLTLLGYLVSQNYASFYMLKGFQNALYLNVSPSSFVLQYPINATANTSINVYATYIPFSYFGNASWQVLNMYNVELSGINGSTFLGNLSYIPLKDGILIPKYTLLGNTYKTLAVYYTPNLTSNKLGYKTYPFNSTTYLDTLQNNYMFVYDTFLNYKLVNTQYQTIPAQPNNATNTAGTFKVSFDTLPIPYFLLTAPNTSYLNLTYYRGTGIIARQIQAVYSNSNALLIGNNNVYKQQAVVDNGLLLNPNGNIWLGYLNMPLYYYNYNITNASTINPIGIGLYYSNYNYILNIQMPNTQQIYSSPHNLYYLIPAYANANITLQASQQQNITTLPNFEYQFNLTNINWTMRPSDWLNWSGGYTIRGFYNPSIKTSYVMFSLPAYPCLISADGSYGNIQAYGYQGSTNLGRIPISQFKKDGNTIYYVMPNLTTKGLAYSNAVVYICSPTQNAPSQLSPSNFVIADYQGSGNASGITYTVNNPRGIIFINPTLFYGNETISSYNLYGWYWQYVNIYAQQIQESTAQYGTYSLNQLANNKIYITAPTSDFGGWGYTALQLFWSNNEAFITTCPGTGNNCYALYNATMNMSVYPPTGTYQSTSFRLPYDAHATIVNYFTTKYQMGNLTAVASPSSSNNNSGVSNPVILPTSPKLNLSITNTTLMNNLNNLKQQFNKQVVLYGMNIPLGLIYIVDLFLIIALAIFSKHEGAFIIALAIFWFSGLLFIQQLVIASIITIVYATYRLEGIFHKGG